MKLKVIITGSTGMVGKGVLLECIDSPDVESILDNITIGKAMINVASKGYSKSVLESIDINNI